MVHFYCKPNTPLSNATEIAKMLKDVINFTTESLKDKMLQCSTLAQAQQFVRDIEIDDKQYRSEYMFKKYLKESNLWFEPTAFVINHEFVQTIVDMENEIVMDTYRGIVMPIEDQIRSFLQLPGMLKLMLNEQGRYFVDNCTNKPIAHFCQASLWKGIVNKNVGKKIIPIMIYNDDFKIDDSVGPHGGDTSISAFYYQFPSLPSYLKSKLQYIFVGMLTLSKHVKECTADSALNMILNIFTRLEVYGIEIVDEVGERHKIHFILTNVLGDNLGIHTILGFAQSFNATYYCRFCITPKSRCQHMFNDKDIVLRCIER